MNTDTAGYKIKFLKVIYVIALIIVDIFIFIMLSLFFMGYEDFYDESKGPYMSLQSMTASQKVIYFAINLWYVTNIILIIWSGFKIYKWFRNRSKTTNAI